MISAVIATAVIGNFFFVEPAHRITVHAQGFSLLLYFGLAAVIATLASRRVEPGRGQHRQRLD